MSSYKVGSAKIGDIAGGEYFSIATDGKIKTVGSANFPVPVFVFRGDGILRAVTDLDAAQAIGSGTIKQVRLLRRDAGSSGTTTIDVHKNGTTIFTTQGNRPSVAFGDGDNATYSAVPDVTEFVDGDIFTLDIDEAEVDAQDVQVIILEG